MGFGYGYGRTTYHAKRAVVTSDGKRAKQVFSNDMLAHVWAQQNQGFGRSGNGNFYFEGATIFSYGSHFPVATFTGKIVDGKRVVLFTNAHYSVSTSGHVGDARRALRGLADIVPVYVPDLKAWFEAQPKLWELNDETARPVALKRAAAFDQEVINSYARRIAGINDTSDYVKRERAEVEAYRKAFKVKARLPKDCAKWAADEKAANEKRAFDGKVKEARDFAKKIDGRNPLASVLLPEYAAPNPGANLYSIDDALRMTERAKEGANKARYWLSKGKASDDYKARVGKLIKQLKSTTAAWESARAQRQAAEALERARAFAEAIRNGSFNNGMARGIIDGARKGKAWEWHDSMTTFRAQHDLRCMLETLKAAGDETTDIEAWCFRMASLAFAVDAINRQCGRTPDCFRPDYNRHGRDGRTPEARRAAWLSGENVTGFYEEAPTLVRRKGDKLETSRGAYAPFGHAVAIFVKAQACRSLGKEWHRNGETMAAGHFQLESIDATGNIQVGCHRIDFAEMQRLAMAEAPAAIRANYPLPVVIA